MIYVLGKPGIAHRDLKSKNILVKNDLTCCIADLGSFDFSTLSVWLVRVLCVCVFVSVCVCACMRAYLSTTVHRDAHHTLLRCPHVYVYVHHVFYVCVCVCVYICACTLCCVYICVIVYICMYIYVCRYVYIIMCVYISNNNVSQSPSRAQRKYNNN